MHSSFLLVFYGNTGSSWLIQTLGNIPGVFVPGVEPLDEWAWDTTDDIRLTWLRTVLSPPSDRSGPDYERWLQELHAHPHFRDPRDPAFVHIGFKMRSHSIRNRLSVLETLAELDSRLIVLERRNRIKHSLCDDHIFPASNDSAKTPHLNIAIFPKASICSATPWREIYGNQ